jgi:hypothetical protein
MLGSLSEAEDALQEAWLRLSGSDAEQIEHLEAWLTTVVGRVCLNMLRSRNRRREDSYGLQVPDPILGDARANDPEGEAKIPDADLSIQREVVEAFFAAARDGDFDRLVAWLDPDVVLHVDAGRGKKPGVARGAAAVARASITGARSGRTLRPILVNGSPGAVVFEHGQPVGLMGYTVVQGRIVEIDIIRDPDRLGRLDLASVLMCRDC